MKIRSAMKIVYVNLAVLLVCLAVGSLTLRMLDVIKNRNESRKTETILDNKFDRNTIRATYPMYRDIKPEYAKSIFTDYKGPGTTYFPFTGWRRKPYAGSAVNIEDQYRSRLSANHKVDNSIWFFGGSTMWGTGSDDLNTIPSHYGKITGDSVWNLGESGYNSFQEFVQLSMLLSKGLKPRYVIFYDGVNETYYCNTNNKNFPTHSRAERWEEYIRDYSVLKKEIKRLKTRLTNMETNTISEYTKNKYFIFLKSIYSYFADPYIEKYNDATNKRVIARKPSKNMASDTPFSDFRQQGKYMDCDKSEEKVNTAALTTVRTWLMVHDILKAKNIGIKIFLQPTSHLYSNNLQIDYLIDSEKQRIVDERASYKAQYAAIKKNWFNECIAHKACEDFHDISMIFEGFRENIFIDAIHISPVANKMVADKMASIITRAQ